MKILQLGKFYPLRGGVEIVMYKLALGLSARGIRCDLFYASTDGDTSTIKLNDHCSIYRSRTWFMAKATMISPGMIVRLRKIQAHYDIIHIHHPDPMAALALYLSGFKGKVVLHWHCDIIRQNSLLKYYEPLQRWLIRRADVIVGTSPVYLSCSQALLGVLGKTVCVPIGVSAPQRPCPGSNPIASQYPGKHIIFTLGRLVSYKGFEYLIDAAGMLGDDYVVLIGGNGNQRQSLQRRIDEAGLQERVRLVGFVPDSDLPMYFDACRLFCLSSIDKREAFAIVQIEAMAYGKPVVSTDIEGSGVPWVNMNGVSGITVKPCDSRALASAIRQLCSDETTYRSYCQGARQRFEQLFHIDRMIQKMYETYQHLT